MPVQLQGKQFGLPKSQGRLTKPSQKGPFAVSGLNSTVPGAVTNFVSQFSFTLLMGSLLSKIIISVDGATAAGANVAIPSLIAQITQPAAANPIVVTAGTFLPDLYFSSTQQFIDFIPVNPLFVSAQKTVAITITCRLAAAAGATDAFRVGFVACFE